jgi:hypothetical protein
MSQKRDNVCELFTHSMEILGHIAVSRCEVFQTLGDLLRPHLQGVAGGLVES